MNIYIYIYIVTCIRMYVFMYKYIYIYICVCVCVYICAYACHYVRRHAIGADSLEHIRCCCPAPSVEHDAQARKRRCHR